MEFILLRAGYSTYSASSRLDGAVDHAKSMLESAREPSGCDLAYACGYYDQTHPIQEFKLFTGQTPTLYERVRPVGFFLAELGQKVYYFIFWLTKEGKVAHLRFNPA